MNCLSLVEQFFQQYPTFRGQDRDWIEVTLEQAAQDLNVGVWGDRYQKALFLLTAHYLTREFQQRQAIASDAISASKGEGVEGVASPAHPWEATAYGQELLRMQASLPVTGFFV